MATSSLRVADIIRQQLGGLKFEVMTGAKSFVTVAKQCGGLAFKLPYGLARSRVNYIEILLNEQDLYDVIFYRMRGVGLTEQVERTGVSVEQLRKTFEDVTGLATHL